MQISHAYPPSEIIILNYRDTKTTTAIIVHNVYNHEKHFISNETVAQFYFVTQNHGIELFYCRGQD